MVRQEGTQMIENLSALINLQDESDRRIIFAVVDERVDKATGINGIWFFPTEESLRKWRLGRKDVIWLQELNDPNCKECNGTGKIGVITRQSEVALEDIEHILRTNLEDSPDLIPGKIVEKLKLSPNLKKPLDFLVSLAIEDLSDSNLDLVARSYAKQIK